MLVKDRIDQSIADTNVNAEQIMRFEALAKEWWKPDGKFRVMHGFNDARGSYIQTFIANKFNRDLTEEKPLRHISVLDVGCGGGLASEPLASLGAMVVGVDATSRNIEIARCHAHRTGVEIDYRHGTAHSAVAAEELFDVVLNLEVIEHVDNPRKLIADCTAHLKPGGVIFIATLNRSFRALVLAIIGGEYILRWLPVGTHDWRRFLKPLEVEAMLASEELMIGETVGIGMNPLSRKWRITANTSVNYMLIAQKPANIKALREPGS